MQRARFSWSSATQPFPTDVEEYEDAPVVNAVVEEVRAAGAITEN